MNSKKYTYSNRTLNKPERVNVWQLQQKVTEQARQIQLLQRAISHQAGVNAQQVLMNESLRDRIAALAQFCADGGYSQI